MLTMWHLIVLSPGDMSATSGTVLDDTSVDNYMFFLARYYYMVCWNGGVFHSWIAKIWGAGL
jgi:hypothetical protein